MGKWACCLFLTLTLVMGAIPQDKDVPWTDVDWKWLGENFPIVLAHVFDLKKDQHVLVSYRSFESLQIGELEYSFWISERVEAGRAGFFIHVRMPDGEPLGAQLLAFHRKFRAKPISEAEKNLRLRDWEFSEGQCSGLRPSIEKLERVPLGWTFNKIVLDPTIHEFHFHSYTGNVDVAVYNEENPLVKWARDTRNVLHSCGAEGPR